MKVETALVALGSNLGDRRARLDTAIDSLSRTPGIEVQTTSRSYETAPVGGPPGQGPFLNAATRLESSLTAEELHARLLEIEEQGGRVRGDRWGERTLDLDLILFGDQRIDTTRLVVPHPRFAVRRFVLSPLVEIAPEMVDPLTGLSLASLLCRLDRRKVVLFGRDRALVHELEKSFPEGWSSVSDPASATFAAAIGELVVDPPAGIPILRLEGTLAELQDGLRAACQSAD